jgi:hypothetical protein
MKLNQLIAQRKGMCSFVFPKQNWLQDWVVLSEEFTFHTNSIVSHNICEM